MPRGEHTGTVTYVVCHTVAFLGSLCFAGAAFLGNDFLVARVPEAALPQLAGFQSFMAAAVVFLLSYLTHVNYFQRT